MATDRTLSGMILGILVPQRHHPPDVFPRNGTNLAALSPLTSPACRATRCKTYPFWRLTQVKRQFQRAHRHPRKSASTTSLRRRRRPRNRDRAPWRLSKKEVIWKDELPADMMHTRFPSTLALWSHPRQRRYLIGTGAISESRCGRCNQEETPATAAIFRASPNVPLASIPLPFEFPAGFLKSLKPPIRIHSARPTT